MTNPADAALYGLHDGLLALAWLAGAALPIAGAALILAAAVVATRGARRRITSARLHRTARRSGRTYADEEHAIVRHLLTPHPEFKQYGGVLDGSEPILPPRS